MFRKITALVFLITLFAYSAPSKAEALATTVIGANANTTVKVMSANALDGVLTVTLSFKNDSEHYEEFLFYGDEAYIIANAQKYTVMKDLSTGEFLASPLGNAKRRIDGEYKDLIGFNLGPDKSGIIWMKFPAPPVGTDAVELLFPNSTPLMFRINRM